MNFCQTLSSEQKEFSWEETSDGFRIVCPDSEFSISRADYRAMLNHINARQGIQLGASMTGQLPNRSLGRFMEDLTNKRIRRWCCHLVAIAVQRKEISFEDRGRGPGGGIWLFPSKP